METTFITINDLSPEARILYSSDSIVDVLGYAPDEVVNRSCWDYFHPNELAMAKKRHSHSIRLDKAAVISYAQVRDREGYYVGCEIVFTVVHDVLVGCISIYRRGLKSQSRATEAPVVRRLFSTSPRDPRYHMLSHLSSKFEPRAKQTTHEPRAALFVNRYTRTLTIMYATNGLADVLGVDGEDLRGRSFYYCIQENCLQDAIRCLENAKANDSIAYLRFWFRDPTQDDDNEQDREQDRWQNPRDGRMDIDSSEDSGIGRSESEDTDMGGVDLNRQGHTHSPRHQPALGIRSPASGESQAVSSASSVEPMDSAGNYLPTPDGPDSRASSGDSNPYTHEAVFGEPPERESSASSVSNSPSEQGQGLGRRRRRGTAQPVELEAVVSCTSDGLVVCLRRARAPVTSSDLQQPAQSMYSNGLFAVPWATNPILPPISKRPQFIHSNANGIEASHATASANAGPDFMNSIREIAVFAWALTGINGSIADYSKGAPCGEAQPAAGLPIWRPEAIHHRANGADRQTRDPCPQTSGGSDNALLSNGTRDVTMDVNEAMGASSIAMVPKPNFSKPLRSTNGQSANNSPNPGAGYS